VHYNTPLYITKRHSIYYYQRRFGTRIFKKSLKTDSFKEAIRLSKEINDCIADGFSKVDKKSLTVSEIRRKLLSFKKRTYDDASINSASYYRRLSVSADLFPDEVSNDFMQSVERKTGFQWEYDQLNKQLSEAGTLDDGKGVFSEDYYDISEGLQDYVVRFNSDVERMELLSAAALSCSEKGEHLKYHEYLDKLKPTSDEDFELNFLIICNKLKNGELPIEFETYRIFELAKQKDLFKYVSEDLIERVEAVNRPTPIDHEPVRTPVEEVIDQEPPVLPIYGFHEALQDFLDFKIVDVNLTVKMQRGYKTFIDFTQVYFADIDVTKITTPMLRGLVKAYQGTPARNRKPYNTLSWSEIKALESVPDAHQVSDATASDFKKFLQGVFAYLLDDKGVISTSPAQRLKLDLETDSRQGSYTKSQLSLLEKAALNLPENKRAFMWFVLIGMYSGLRSGEVRQLRKQDIKTDDDTGILFFDITPDAGSLKNTSSRRVVPIHQRLRELGLLDYIEGLSGDLVLSGLQIETSGAFSRFRIKCNVPDTNRKGEKLVYHSLRHTMATVLTGANLQKKIIQSILGHKGSRDITDRYTHDIDIRVLKESIDKFSIFTEAT
jgi:integrase